MRWLSSFAILLYLSLLCMPQAFAVHDKRLSPMAETQLQAITPALHQTALNTEQDAGEEQQPALPVAALKNSLPLYLNSYSGSRSLSLRHFLLSLQARAPPLLSSL
jgi:hypothetical protein